MKVQFLYNQGSAQVSEDGIVFLPPHYFGVSDGISEVYLPHEGPRLFNGMTGGELASHIVSHAFAAAIPGDFLEVILRKADDILRNISTKNGLSILESELLPSAAFSVARVTPEEINIIQAGDSFAVWQTKDGIIGGTPNKAFTYEKDLLETIAALMKKHKGNRQKMWEEFRPYLIQQRRANINTPKGRFALLNGQPASETFWHKAAFKREEMSLLLLFTDGFVPFEWTENENVIAERVIALYKEGGLEGIRKTTYMIAEGKKDLTHEDYPEFTAIAIEL